MESTKEIAGKIVAENLDEMMSPREYVATKRALIDHIDAALKDRDERAAKIAEEYRREYRYTDTDNVLMNLANAIRR